MTGQQGEREALAQRHARARRAAAFTHHRYDARPPQPDDYVAADVTLAYLAAQPRVTPSAEEVRRCVGQPLAERVPDDAMDDDAFDALGDETARAILALFAAQPTVQQVREQVAAELAFSDAEWRAYQDIPDQGYSHRAWLDSRAARIARGEKGGA